ncbi:MAG TPA: SAM-dependent methyltransferase [Trebonia sp.]|nr:SAM-dependent methyltransferase [Trebonia sp.]
MTNALHAPDGLDASRPSPARIYDYMLGGHSYLDVDEAAAKRIIRAVPEIRDTAWANRGYHQRTATWIARQGVRQFLDIGSGLPTVGNTHEVVKTIHPDAHVVYVDNDPMVELHSRAMIASDDTVSVLCADLRDPDSILTSDIVRELIDPREPTGIMMTAVLMFVSDASDPWSLVSRYVHAVPPGSFLSLTHLTDDSKPPAAAEGFRAVFDHATEHMHFRSKAQVEGFFTGLEMVPPYQGAAAVVNFAGLWGAEDPELADSEGSRWMYSGVGKIS